MSMVLLGVLVTLVACLCLYLGSANQTLLTRPWPAGPARIGGLLGLILGLFVFNTTMQALAGTFTFVVVLILALSILPYLGAWRSLGIPEAERRRRRA